MKIFSKIGILLLFLILTGCEETIIKLKANKVDGTYSIDENCTSGHNLYFDTDDGILQDTQANYEMIIPKISGTSSIVIDGIFGFIGNSGYYRIDRNASGEIELLQDGEYLIYDKAGVEFLVFNRGYLPSIIFRKSNKIEGSYYYANYKKYQEYCKKNPGTCLNKERAGYVYYCTFTGTKIVK